MKIAGWLATCFLAVLLLATACTPAPEKDDTSTAQFLSVTPREGYLEARDAVGRRFALIPRGSPRPAGFPPHMTVEIPVKRVVSASGAFDSGIMVALGVEDALVGQAEPPEQWLPTIRRGYEQGRIAFIGLWNTLDYERIKQLRPDLALASGDPTTIDMLTQMDLPAVITFNNAHCNLESRLKFFAFLAAFFDRGERAAQLRQNFATALAEVQAKIGQRPRPTVSWVIAQEKRAFVLSGHYWLAELFGLTGGDYLFSEVGTDHEISLEYLIQKSGQADIFFVNTWVPPRSKRDLIRLNPILAPLKALGPEGRAYVVQSILFQETGRLDEVVRDLAAIMHPEVFPDRKLLYFRLLPMENPD